MRTVAIVGRPNVGKSALFNRLAGKKISIVHDQPGVTRDRLTALCALGDVPFVILDTGGIGAEPDPLFAAPTKAAAEEAMAEADLLALVVDGQDGLTPGDQGLATRLRSLGKPLLLIINKIDVPSHDSLLGEFARLGFSHQVGMSAAHGRGLDELLRKIDEMLPLEEEQEEDEEKLFDEEGDALEEVALRPARIVLCGRPNVGKSSLTNAIVGARRTIVSEVAGTTRDAVEVDYSFAGQDYVLCDTAGMRHRSKHNTSVEVFSVMRSEKALRGADLCLLIIDAQEGVTGQDKKIAQLVQKASKPVVIVLNKWDLAGSGQQERAALEEHRQKTHAELFFLRYAPIVALSALEGSHVERLFRQVEKVRQHAARRIGTGELNRYIHRCMEEVPPPMRGNRRLKLLYATHVAPNRPGPFAPPEIVCFANDPKLLVPTYGEYLLRRLREKWEFPGLPIRLRWRSRTSSED
jgi:GTP-binding protein